jgi:GT2 family glycosyltransferase
MLKRETYEDIGDLDEHFWLYTEEADWCYRARKANYAVFHVPDAKVYHHARAASGQRYELTMLHFYQSRVRFAHKHYGFFHAWLLQKAIRLKTTIWICAPNQSPLREAYAELSSKQIADAYRTLRRELMGSLLGFLARDWMHKKTSTAKYEPGGSNECSVHR